jgi:PAS domain-containing protein
MGALFMCENEGGDVILRPLATVAYDRAKIMNKTYKIGESLVGRCAFEKAYILLNEIPSDYLNFSSGLGHAEPTNILIVPLIHDDKIYGVFELASFNEFEAYHIQFVTNLTDNIAAALSTLQLNEQTRKLLAKSNVQQEELALKEETMRLNMEELLEAQEQFAEREQTFVDLNNAYDSTFFKIVYDLEGKIVEVNDKYASFLGIDSTDLINESVEKELLLLNVSKNKIFAAMQIPDYEKELVVEAVVDEHAICLKQFYKPMGEGSNKRIMKLSFVV